MKITLRQGEPSPAFPSADLEGPEGGRSAPKPHRTEQASMTKLDIGKSEHMIGVNLENERRQFRYMIGNINRT